MKGSNLNIRVLPYTVFIAFILMVFELIKIAVLEEAQVWLSFWLTVGFVTLVSFISLSVLKKAVDDYYNDLNRMEINAKLSAEAANEQLVAANQELQASTEELKATTEELEMLKEELALVINSIPDGIVRTDPKGAITLANQELLIQTGMTRQELIGRDIRIAFWEEDRPQFMAAFQKVLEGVPAKELSFHSCLGNHILVDMYALKDNTGRVQSTLGVTREFTKTTKVIEALDDSKKELGKKIAEMEILLTVTLDREKRIMELKNQVEALNRELAKSKGNI